MDYYIVIKKETNQQVGVELIKDHNDGNLGKNEEYYFYKEVSSLEFDLSKKYKLENNELVIDDSFDETIRQKKISKVSLKIKAEKDRRIQTIPANIREKFGKKGDKFYSDGTSWMRFYQMCQNIIIKLDLEAALLSQNGAEIGKNKKEIKKAANLVISRIKIIDDKSEEIIENLETLSIEELNRFDPEDEKHWEIEDFLKKRYNN